MNKIDITNIDVTKKVIFKYFHNKIKLYSLSNEEIKQHDGLWDTEIMYIFNDKTWEEVFENTDYLSQTVYLQDTYSMLYAPMELFQDKNRGLLNNIIEIKMENIYFYFTGLFYMWAIVEMNDTSFNPNHLYTITDFLDPKNPYFSYILYDPPLKNFFPALIERYTQQQLFLLSILFIELQNHIDISELGIKYWTWIYENTDNEIREKITKEFEDASR